MSYEFDNYFTLLTGPTTTYDYTIPSGVPQAVGALGQAFIVTDGPDDILGVKFPASPPPTTGFPAKGLSFTPYTLDAFVPYGPVGTEFDALVGGGGAATLYEYVISPPSKVFEHTAIVSGNAVAVSPSPNFDQISVDEAVVATTAAKLYDIDFSNPSPTPSTTADVSAYGTPIGVDFGDNGDVWLITDQGWLAVFGPTPGLSFISSQSGKINAGLLVAVNGAKSESIGSVVVASAAGGGFGPQLNVFPGGDANSVAAKTYTLPGDPVDMRVTTDGNVQWAWVAIRSSGSGPQLLVVDVSKNPPTLVDSASLPGVPIRLAIGLAAGALFPPSPSKGGGAYAFPGPKSGFIHVIVAE